MLPNIICLMGPTASGKTDLAMQIASKKNIDIISVDSAMVYRGMDIGTGKPSLKEQSEFPHHLINICDPKESYSAAKFCNDATTAIKNSLQNGKVPLLVGGTMMYFKALQQGLSNLPAADPIIRKQILDDASTRGWQQLHNYLSDIDPQSAKNIKNTDTQRIQRAIEVYKITGTKMSDLIANNTEHSATLSAKYNFINIALTLPRSTLHENIAKRFNNMLKDGFIEEVAQLYAREDLHIDLPAIRSVGYRQIWQYLNGMFDKQAMQDKVLAATRQLAKRQCTWLRSWPNLKFINANQNKYLAYCELMLD